MFGIYFRKWFEKKKCYGLYNNNKNGFGEMIDFTTLYVLNTFGAIFDGSKTIFDSFCERLLK